MICPRCGHFNDGNTNQCESCYTSLDPDTSIEASEEYSSPYDMEKSDKTKNACAAFGMLMGIGSVITCCTSPLSGLYAPGILGFIGLIISLTGKSQINKNPETQEGMGLATIGMILGGTGLLGSIISLILWFLGIGLLDYLGDMIR